ncbi:DUF4198 domain-containing protein [Undibacterium sp. SXout7W]|uniref:DUF4198 domain-containing protein n=1 Tax=Undibacterium sp. SXout7W TaxID=3413049 RepID=UPI003BF4251A
MKTLRQLAALTILAATTLSAQAHRPFLLPSSTVTAGNTPWVTVDAAAASDVFFFDHMPLKLDALIITAPDGSKAKPENSSTGKFRSSFDLALTQTGSYKLSLVSDTLMASYKENGSQKRWRGSAENFSKEVPANAEDLQVTQRSSRVETFVTNGKPGGKALEISGSGLELQALTHPNDLVAGETARFRLLIDGKPAANAHVIVIAGGIRYRQKLDETLLNTDASGTFSIQWPSAGIYWLEAEIKDSNNVKAPAKTRAASYAATLEVLPQ